MIKKISTKRSKGNLKKVKKALDYADRSQSAVCQQVLHSRIWANTGAFAVFSQFPLVC